MAKKSGSQKAIMARLSYSGIKLLWLLYINPNEAVGVERGIDLWKGAMQCRLTEY
jgi:hypothetical protein